MVGPMFRTITTMGMVFKNVRILFKGSGGWKNLV